MISPTLNTSQTSQTAQALPPAAETAIATSSDFETFLKMLTAQARYQDPLEPLDSSDYATQLAQFSMVEQQVLSNDLLTSLAGQLGAGNMTQMASWIGMEARTIAPVNFEGSPVTLYPNPVAAADEVVMVVYNSADQVVQRSTLPVSAEPVEWAGVGTGGTPFENGLYRIEFESRANGQVLATDPAESYARITEARMQDGSAVLIVDGGTPILASAVAAIREAG